MIRYRRAARDPRVLATKPTTGWALRRRLLVHGVETLWIFAHTSDYSLKGRAEMISCPMFVCNAEGDDISASAPHLVDALTVEKEYVRFTAAEGAGDHCEAGARTLYMRGRSDGSTACSPPTPELRAVAPSVVIPPAPSWTTTDRFAGPSQCQCHRPGSLPSSAPVGPKDKARASQPKSTVPSRDVQYPRDRVLQTVQKAPDSGSSGSSRGPPNPLPCAAT